MAKTWRILSIDGGGIRGIIPAVLLQQLEKTTGRGVSELFDFVTGTSTGAIIAIGLTTPTDYPSEIADGNNTARYRAEDVVNFYLDEGGKIFNRSARQDLKEWLFGGSRYDSQPLQNRLQSYFADTKLGASLSNVMIASYCLEKRIPMFFKSWKQNEDAEFLCREIITASTAAPTYFQPTQLHLQDGAAGFIDGGLIANNPAMTALIECKRYANLDDNFLVVSLGTGKYQRSFKYEEVIHWRPIDWINPIIDICMDGADAKTDYELLQLSRASGLHYYRFDTALNSEMDALDNASRSNMEKLMEIAKQIYSTNETAKFAAMTEELVSLFD